MKKVTQIDPSTLNETITKIKAAFKNLYYDFIVKFCFEELILILFIKQRVGSLKDLVEVILGYELKI